MHQQAPGQLHGPLALVTVRKVHRAAGPRRGRTPAGPPGLDRSLLVGADDDVPLPSQRLGALVELQNGESLVPESAGRSAVANSDTARA